jgi:membrane-associated phospholipid phosphatase
LTNNRAQRLVIFLSLVVVGELVFLPTLLPFDVAVYNWIEYQRGCSLSRILSSEWPLATLIFFVTLLLGYLCYQRRWAEAVHGTAIVVIGGFLGEFLKTAFERPRPSVISSLLVGNSFPSGHTAGAIFLFGTMSFWLLRQPISRLMKVGGILVLGVLACTVIGQRLYLARHWLSDIIGTALLAMAWLGLTLSRPIGWSGARPIIAACGTLLIGYPLFYAFPALRIDLPSTLSTVQEEPLLSFSFGATGGQAPLQGAWGENGQEAIGPITWMRRGEASVEVSLHNQHGYSMRFAARPFLQEKGFACFPLEVSLNQRLVRRVLLDRGWREYELHLDPAWVVPGINTLTFRTGADFPSATRNPDAVAFHRVSVFARK